MLEVMKKPGIQMKDYFDLFGENRTVYFIDKFGYDYLGRYRANGFYRGSFAISLVFSSEENCDKFIESNKESLYADYDLFRKDADFPYWQ